ncbi:MAG: fibronectin type III domain-containing protein [Candidatus Berkelbacteria bacterium Gr01-1014_85]|uniref:Fibronectin type III domain-containing protein n=1 Tax=Candidatus Berkelbacteria bacterium Gr01-1014_85 TaxID=2017150 RepID=A0A554JBM6_9BACT|nr:MAG: fibronectin type III domain-containing protein [Candidatus Berkelbacteria bacterium Gr01-1014_85]
MFQQGGVKVASLLLTIGLLWPISSALAIQASSSNFQLTDIYVATSIVGTASTKAQITEGPTVTAFDATKLTVAWKTDQASSSTVRYGKTTAYGLEAGTTETSTSHQVTIPGLTPETLYHLQVVSRSDDGATVESADFTATTTAESGINAVKISDIGYDRALITWKTGRPTTTQIEYGTTAAYGESTNLSKEYTKDHTVQLTGLKSGVEYHLRIIAEASDGNSQSSSDMGFATIAEPKFVSVKAVPSGANAVDFIWTTNTATSGLIEFQPVDDLAKRGKQTAGDSAYLKTHQLSLSGLVGNSTYRYTLTATDQQGKQIKTESKEFTTATDTTAPEIKDLKVTVERSSDQLILRAKWITNEPAKSSGQLQAKSGNATIKEVAGGTAFQLQQELLASGDLSPLTPYKLTVHSVDPFGNTANQEISFTTPKNTKSIFELIVDGLMGSFGWLIRIFEGG